MFEWFDKKFHPRKYPTWADVPPPESTVVKFPELKKVPPMPEVEPPKEKPANTYYRLGLTDNNRISLQMGYSEVTMNKEGVQNLIDQLTLFMNQLSDHNNDDAS